MAPVATAPATLADVEVPYCGTVYPDAAVFDGCETALCLFSAAYHGAQDVYWLANYGLTGTCVDLDGEKLSEMAAVYPAGWEFVQDDVFDFADGQQRRWDVVTLDPWTGQFERCADMIDTWTSLARRAVVLGHGNYRLTPPAAPEGWKLVDTRRRSDFKGGVNWLVFTRA